VGFSSSIVPTKWKFLYSLNPMVGVVDGFRWCIIGEEALYFPGLLLSLVITLGFLLLGIWYFRKTEKSFADNI
jgi:lipopolysaccharide transport system permease protein